MSKVGTVSLRDFDFWGRDDRFHALMPLILARSRYRRANDKNVILSNTVTDDPTGDLCSPVTVETKLVGPSDSIFTYERKTGLHAIDTPKIQICDSWV